MSSQSTLWGQGWGGILVQVGGVAAAKVPWRAPGVSSQEKASIWLSMTTMSLRVPVPQDRDFYWDGCPHFTEEEAEAWGGRGDPRFHIGAGG